MAKPSHPVRTHSFAALAFATICSLTSASIAHAQPRCHVMSRPGLKPRHLIFVFEGHENFIGESRDLVRGWIRAGLDCSPNLEATAPQAATARFADGRSRPVDELNNELYALNTGDATTPALRAVLLEALCKRGGLDFSDTELLYFDEEAPRDQALACAGSLAASAAEPSENDESPPRPSVSVIGYSHGGSVAIQFAHELRERHVPVDLGITIDPVPKTVGQTWDVVWARLGWEAYDAKPRPDFAPPSGTRWINFWQTLDNRWKAGSEGGNIGLHGIQVQGAESNEFIAPQVPAGNPQGNGAHWRILFEPKVTQRIADEIRRLRRKFAIIAAPAAESALAPAVEASGCLYY